MTVSTIPANGWRLTGTNEDKSRTAIVLSIPHARVEELKGNKKIQLITNGTQPSIRYGTNTIQLSLDQEQCTNEIYAHTSHDRLTHHTNATHRARAAPTARGSIDDDMLALEQSYARIAEEKVSQAEGRNGISKQIASPMVSASDPTLVSNAKTTKGKAIRHAVIHLLAMRPLSTESIAARVRIPSPELKKELQNLGRVVEGTWELTDKMYKELDVWRFKYPTENDRQASVDHAVKAYDRMRLPKDDKLWQLLLPKADRGKGKVLSKREDKPRNLSPAPGSLSAVNSPQLSGTGTPSHSNKKDLNRLFAKDPKKARALAEAKEKRKANNTHTDDEARAKKHVNSVEKRVDTAKRKSNEAEKEERPAKRQAVSKKLPANAKSQEFVFSSSDEADKQDKPASSRTKSAEPSKSTPLSKAASSQSQSQSTSQQTGKLTPSSSNKTKAHISPPKALRPTVPSPLGAARPRVASDVSDRSGISQRRSVADAPKGLGISIPPRKRHDTLTDNDSNERPMKLKFGTGTSVTTKIKAGSIDNARKPATTASNHNKHSTSSGGRSSDSSMSVVDTISFSQGVSLAENFQDKYYPQYAKMYDSLAAKQQNGDKVGRSELNKLWDMHNRLKQMKSEIEAAAERQQSGAES